MCLLMTMEINLNLDKKLVTPKFLPYMRDYSHRWEIWYGGAGSSKSYSIVQKLIIRCCSEQIKILVCRKYGSTLRNTCFSLFKEVLTKWKLMPYCKVKETDFSISFPNGSQVIMMGLDEETKLLSLNNIGTIWIEEAYEVSKDLVEQLNLRMRSNNQNQQIIMSYNPISKNHWLYSFEPNNCIKIHSTFKDNPFLSPEYIEAMEDLRVRNPAKAKVYYYGEYGVDSDGLVFQNWMEDDLDAIALAAKGYEHRVGCDLGWIDPTTIVETLYDKENETIYVINVFYKKGCQLSELVAQFQEMGLTKTKIQVDAAEPRTIQYLRSEGINAVACAKGKDSVRIGMAWLQDRRIIVDRKLGKSLITDLENFSFIKSKQTGEYTQDTTHEYSHAIDALKYAYSDVYTDKKLKTINKSVLSI